MDPAARVWCISPFSMSPPMLALRIIKSAGWIPTVSYLTYSLLPLCAEVAFIHVRIKWFSGRYMFSARSKQTLWKGHVVVAWNHTASSSSLSVMAALVPIVRVHIEEEVVREVEEGTVVRSAKKMKPKRYWSGRWTKSWGGNCACELHERKK